MDETGGAERRAVSERPDGTLAGPDGVEGRAKGNQTPDFPPVPVPFLLQRLKYLLTPREPNRWAVDRDGGALYSSHSAMNGTLVKPTHIIVETMM